MKILVIDDTQSNLEAAKEQLQNHDVTLCSDYVTAEQLLTQSPEKSNESNASAGHNFIPGEPNFDMVLTDLFMPASVLGNSQEAREKYKDQEQPYGLVFMLIALRRGVKYLGLSTDANRHGSPMSWAVDALSGGVIKESVRKVIKSYLIGSTRVAKSVEMIYGGEVPVKNWKVLFERLANESLY